MSELDRKIESATIELARRDPDEFAEYVMEDEETGDPFVLADFHREWNQLMTDEDRLLIEGPREHGKSGTIVSRALFELGINPNIRIKIICCSDTMAKKRLMAITMYIEESERLHKVFPMLKPALRASWTKTQIYVDRKVKSGEPSVEAFGILSSSSGSRADLLLLDDICDARNTIINPALQDTVRQTLFDNIMNFLPADGGRAWYICTPWTTGDVTNDLKAIPAWKQWRRPVTVDDPLWPERWSREALAKRKDELPLRSWQRQFELVVIAEEGATFSHKALKDHNNVKVEQFREDGPVLYFAGVDLAIATSKKAANFVVVIGALGANKEKHLIETVKHKGVSFRQQIEIIKDVNTRYELQLVMVETNAYQDSMRQELEDVKGLNVRGYTTSGKSKRDLELGIPGFAGEIEKGQWTIWDSEGSNEPTLDEMKAYPYGDKDDCVMAGFFLREAMRQQGMVGVPIPSVSNTSFQRKIQMANKPPSPLVRPA